MWETDRKSPVEGPLQEKGGAGSSQDLLWRIVWNADQEGPLPSKHRYELDNDLQKEPGTEIASSLNLYCPVRTILDTFFVK